MSQVHASRSLSASWSAISGESRRYIPLQQPPSSMRDNPCSDLNTSELLRPETPHFEQLYPPTESWVSIARIAPQAWSGPSAPLPDQPTASAISEQQDEQATMDVTPLPVVETRLSVPSDRLALGVEDDCIAGLQDTLPSLPRAHEAAGAEEGPPSQLTEGSWGRTRLCRLQTELNDASYVRHIVRCDVAELSQWHRLQRSAEAPQPHQSRKGLRQWVGHLFGRRSTPGSPTAAAAPRVVRHCDCLGASYNFHRRGCPFGTPHQCSCLGSSAGFHRNDCRCTH